MGGPCSNIWCISFLLLLYPWGPTFHDTTFSALFVEIEPDTLRFTSQSFLGILSLLMALNSVQRFQPVRIGAKLACCFLVYAPVNPNMFSTSDPISIVSLLSRLWIQDPMFVLRSRKNSTINFQECLGAWVRQCLFVSPSGMASQSSSSESQSLLIFRGGFSFWGKCVPSQILQLVFFWDLEMWDLLLCPGFSMP